MKKLLATLTVLIMIVSLSACTSLGVDNEAIDKAITRIKAGELDSAIDVISGMDEKTLSSGKDKVLSAVISEIKPYLNFNSWVSTTYDFIDESVIADLEKYQTLINCLSLESDESNVDDFIVKALSLKKYAKWNEYHRTNPVANVANIKNTMDQGAIYKSTPSIASKYYQQAYNDCLASYNKYKDNTGYGMKEVADFYYNYAVMINSVIAKKETTKEQNDAYSASKTACHDIQQEHLDDFDDVIDICESFPKNLY